MKSLLHTVQRAAMLLVIFTVVCGVAYTGLVTGLAQLLFPTQANGSILTVDGKQYGSALMAQPFADDAHLWGRVARLDVTTFTDEAGNPLLYAAPSNLSPASEEYAALIAQRVERQQHANPQRGKDAVPVELVTASGSGLDPHISPAAAEYQVPRIATANEMPEEVVRDIITRCTQGRFLGVFGEETVNVLKVNLMLEGIL